MHPLVPVGLIAIATLAAILLSFVLKGVAPPTDANSLALYATALGGGAAVGLLYQNPMRRLGLYGTALCGVVAVLLAQVPFCLAFTGIVLATEPSLSFFETFKNMLFQGWLALGPLQAACGAVAGGIVWALRKRA